MFTVVKWLQSATIMLLPDNKTVFVSSDVAESTPPVKCQATVNCVTTKKVTRIIFTENTKLNVTPGNNYSISVQVITADTNELLEEHSISKNISVPTKFPSKQNLNQSIHKSYSDVSIVIFYPTATHKDDDNVAIFIAAILGGVAVLMFVTVITTICCVRRRGTVYVNIFVCTLNSSFV